MSEKKINFSELAKKRLRDFNKAEVQGWVIERFIRIEERINNIILDFFKPDNKELFTSVVLNSSVLTIGAKIKILANIGVDNSTINKIRKLASIRNGFAHTLITHQISIKPPSKSEPAKKVETEVTSIVNVMNSSGKIITKNAHEYLSEYLELLQEVEKEI
ncbi:hypothetical protein [Zobellia roscoffensis]|uniref:hypothetical protein n=1 Tax=Zobellia roscoffensis TaxID=2779508 RepID=UPI00188A98E2|nr:hypothetical protein [Zobellia roscoffensis]